MHFALDRVERVAGHAAHQGGHRGRGEGDVERWCVGHGCSAASMASLCVVQFQPIRALQNAGGEQVWVMNNMRLDFGRRCDH